MKPAADHETGDTRDLIPHSQPSIRRADARAAARSVMSRTLVGGPQVSGFEAAVATLTGTAHGCAVGSGTAALHLALSALGVGPGDEVILPAYVCAAPLYAVRYVGGSAVLADVNPDTGISEVRHVRAVLTKRTKAVVVVHLLGRAAPVDEIAALGAPVVEDCAQSLGGTYRGRPLGSWGTAAVFSFYATKVITTGYGGMVCTGDADIIGRVRDLIRYDQRTDRLTGYAYGMTSFQAALGTSQIKRIDEFLQKRRAIHDFYRTAFLSAGIELAAPAEPGQDIHYRFVVKTDGPPDRVIERLAEHGICARRPVFRPLSAYLGTEELPGTERAHSRNVSIPIYPALTTGRMKRVARAVVAVLAERP